jgi:MFS family permease
MYVSWHMRRLFALFNPELPPRMWLLQLGVLVNFLGNGMVGPFLVIYLHFGRGIPLGLAGSAVALGGITAVTSGLLAGSAIDRLGARSILVGAMVCNAVAYLLYTQVTVPWQAFAVGLLVGIGTGAYGPSSQSLTATMVPIDRRAAAFAQNRVTAIVGLGAGAVVGGLLASKGLTGYLQLLELDAITFLAFAAISLLLPKASPVARPASGGGYVKVLRDRAFVRLVGVNLAMVAFGIAPMLVLLPAYAKAQSHVAETAIGMIYAVNTATIVLGQLPLTRLTSGRSRMRLLRIAALLWAACWLICLGAGVTLSGITAAAAIALAALIYGVGECLYTATILPTATALAPEHLRGRYLGAVGLAWQGGFLIGPSLGGAVLGAAPLALPLLCAAGCLAAGASTVAVDRSLSPELRRNPARVAA